MFTMSFFTFHFFFSAHVARNHILTFELAHEFEFLVCFPVNVHQKMRQMFVVPVEVQVFQPLPNEPKYAFQDFDSSITQNHKSG